MREEELMSSNDPFIHSRVPLLTGTRALTCTFQG